MSHFASNLYNNSEKSTLKSLRVDVLKVKFAFMLFVTMMAVAIGTQLLLRNEKALDNQGKNVIKNSVATEYQRYYLSKNDISPEDKILFLRKIQKLKFRSVSARAAQDDVIVRVEVEPTHALPPGTSTVQYYRLKHSPLTGWQNDGKTSATNYYFRNF